MSPSMPFETAADLAAVAEIRREFGGLSHPGRTEHSRRELVVQRFMRRCPRIEQHGVSYAQPYSYGLHLRALKEDRDAFPASFR